MRNLLLFTYLIWKFFILDEILNENEFILNQKFFGNTNDPYYFSPSSTLMRQQKLLQIKQSLQRQKQQQLDSNTPNNEAKGYNISF